MNKKSGTEILLQKLIKKYPKIISGRKNFIDNQKKIKAMVNLIKKYSKKN